jgi:hypothetical protein
LALILPSVENTNKEKITDFCDNLFGTDGARKKSHILLIIFNQDIKAKPSSREKHDRENLLHIIPDKLQRNQSR